MTDPLVWEVGIDVDRVVAAHRSFQYWHPRDVVVSMVPNQQLRDLVADKLGPECHVGIEGEALSLDVPAGTQLWFSRWKEWNPK